MAKAYSKRFFQVVNQENGIRLIEDGVNQHVFEGHDCGTRAGAFIAAQLAGFDRDTPSPVKIKGEEPVVKSTPKTGQTWEYHGNRFTLKDQNSAGSFNSTAGTWDASYLMKYATLVEDIKPAASTPKFRVGQEWRTQEGTEKLCINKIDELGGTFPIIAISEEGVTRSFTEKGEHMHLLKSRLDLVTLVKDVD